MPSYSFESYSDVLIKFTEYSTEILYKKVYCSTDVDGDYLIFMAHDLETGKLQQQYRLLYSDCTSPVLGSAVLLQSAVDAMIDSYTKYYSDLYVGATGANPADNAILYFGQNMAAPIGVASARRIYFRRACTIVLANINMYSVGAGTNEALSLYIRLNNTTDTLVSTLSVATNERIFVNTSLSIAIVSGDYIEMKLVCPVWATNPTGSIIGGYLTLEN